MPCWVQLKKKSLSKYVLLCGGSLLAGAMVSRKNVNAHAATEKYLVARKEAMGSPIARDLIRISRKEGDWSGWNFPSEQKRSGLEC